MSNPDPKVEAFFNKPQAWQAEMAALRPILLGCGLTETFKWRGPCYCAEGGNIVILGGMKAACVLGFFKGVLLPDPTGLLVLPGENSRSARMAKFTSLAEITAATEPVKALIAAAIALEKSGAKVTFAKDDLSYPEELIAALEENPELAQAFDALTPGRKRGYLLHFNQPKGSATKTARIQKHSARILDGKGMHDR
ncbi:YdeI/OmpD-associated family protein [Cypionkella sp.]|uniref:YdeI/OmpD-associated family protein n=1 Tax=Cypionkella sp. TaxID=2811411 RepID=UPI002ABB32E8|nr:YdeI/OmpD-associated family protein [Cypionkella sp.]MDZ4395237.1 YdeI/OmpD-associated family protein [Cypionkella sp.]